MQRQDQSLKNILMRLTVTILQTSFNTIPLDMQKA